MDSTLRRTVARALALVVATAALVVTTIGTAFARPLVDGGLVTTGTDGPAAETVRTLTEGLPVTTVAVVAVVVALVTAVVTAWLTAHQLRSHAPA